MATELSHAAAAAGRHRVPRHALIGVAASLLLLTVYLAILSVAQGLAHALEQTSRLWYWVAVIAGGFGVQAGLFSFIRSALRQRKASATASVATSGGVSTVSMAACCAHHLSDVLPLMGLSGLALFLTRYQTIFLLAGVLSNATGIIIMLETIQRHGLSPAVRSWKLKMGRVKAAAVLLSVLILVSAFLLTWLGT